MTVSEAVDLYVQHKRSLGMKFESPSAALRAFSRKFVGISIADVHPQRVRDFILGSGPLTSAAYQKLATLRNFYRFAISRKMVAYDPLPGYLPKLTHRLVPHIYSRDDIAALLTASGELPQSRLQPHTMRAIVLSLYGAGMRISEALSLTVADVDLTAGVLTVRKSKFYKDRLLPTSSDLKFALQNYFTMRSLLGQPEESTSPFFVTEDGQPVSRQLAEQNFRRLCKIAQLWRSDESRYEPRLHDLRHSFAVHRVVACYRDGGNLNLLLPKLSAYLGHAQLSYTQRYLTMTPELLEQAGLRFEQYALEEPGHERK